MMKHGERLAQNVTLAQMITLSYDLDLDIMKEQADELSRQLDIMPVLEPVEWFTNHKAHEVTLTVLRAGIAFAEAVNKVRAKP
jgi:hypothetical protein